MVSTEFGKTAELTKRLGDGGVQAVMERAGQLIAANIRSNDLAFRYDTSSIAILLGETGEKEAMLAIEKLRKIIGEVRFGAKDGGGPQRAAAQFSAGVAEAVI